MKLIIIICSALCILFIILALVFAKKQMPGLDIPKVNNQQCNIHDTILCENTDECNKKCADGVNSKCYHLYYQNYILPGYSPSINPPSNNLFKLYNTPEGKNNLHFLSYSDVVQPPTAQAIQTPTKRYGTSTSDPWTTALRNPTFIGDSVGGTKFNFPQELKDFAIEIDTQLPPTVTKNLGTGTTNLIPRIDTKKDLLPTCMHTNQVCVYWEYFTEPFQQYTLCDGLTPSCTNSEYNWTNYYDLNNIVSYPTSGGTKGAELFCTLNPNCKGFLKSTKNDVDTFAYIGIPDFSNVPYNDYNFATNVCLPFASPSGRTSVNPDDFCPAPSDLDSVTRDSLVTPTLAPSYTPIAPASIGKGTSTLIPGDSATMCGYYTRNIKSPTIIHTTTTPKMCSPSELDLSSFSSSFLNLQKKTCSFYNSADFEVFNPHYFSPTLPINQRMYNMQQNCNNQTHCVWRDIMTGSDWQEASMIIVPPTPTRTSPESATPLEKLQYVYANLKPMERMMYRISHSSGSGSGSGSGTSSPKVTEYCVDSPTVPGECESLLGIKSVSPSSFDNTKEYSFKIIDFGCADMIGDVNNRIKDSVVNPENNYLYYKNLACAYKHKCVQIQTRAISGSSDQGYKPNPNQTSHFDCDSPSSIAAVATCPYRDKIIEYQSKMATLQNTTPEWNLTPYNTKSGVCLKPPNTFMSDNPCNLFTSRSVVTQKLFDSTSVCSGFSPTECNTDEFCTVQNGQCKGFCETQCTGQTSCNTVGNCKWDVNDGTCKSVKNAWECECLNNENIQNLFEESNNRCNKLQPTRDIPEVNYYGSITDKIYMQYSDNCCYFDQKNKDEKIDEDSIASPIVFSKSLIPDIYLNKCETNKCKKGDALFGQLVIPNCGLIDTSICEPNLNPAGSNNSVDQTWPCKLTFDKDGNKFCENKPGMDAGSNWEDDCYEDGGDGQKVFTYDTCWNPLYGVLSPCGIDYPNNAFAGDLNDYFSKKCVLDNCCNQEYNPATPVDVKANILNKIST